MPPKPPPLPPRPRKPTFTEEVRTGRTTQEVQEYMAIVRSFDEAPHGKRLDLVELVKNAALLADEDRRLLVMLSYRLLPR